MKIDYVILRLIYETKQKITKQNKNRTKKQQTNEQKKNKRTNEQKTNRRVCKFFYK